MLSLLAGVVKHCKGAWLCDITAEDSCLLLGCPGTRLDQIWIYGPIYIYIILYIYYIYIKEWGKRAKRGKLGCPPVLQDSGQLRTPIRDMRVNVPPFWPELGGPQWTPDKGLQWAYIGHAKKTANLQSLGLLVQWKMHLSHVEEGETQEIKKNIFIQSFELDDRVARKKAGGRRSK